MLDLATVTADTFRPHVDSTFAFSVSVGETIDLTLMSVVEAPTQVPGRRPGFTLTFAGGTTARTLPQATYVIRHEELEELELFIVPRTPVGGVPRYDADFN